MPQIRSKFVQETKDRKEVSTAAHGLRVLTDVKSYEEELGNKPIFTRMILERAAKEVECARNHPAALPNGYRVSWTNTRGLSELTAMGRTNIPCYHISEDTDDAIIASQTLKPNDESHPFRQRVACMPVPPDLEQMKALETELLVSPFWANLKKHLDTMQVEVKNIVCVALGSLFEHHESNQKEGNLSPRTCSQHLLACAISKYLSQKYASAPSFSTSPSSSIPIVAYDPAYTLNQLSILSKLATPITVVSDPYQYLVITPHTLFMAIGIPVFVPIHEIAADLCFPSGPAAILCNEILEHLWHATGHMVCLDQMTPRLGRMLKLYNAKWLGREEDDIEALEMKLGHLSWAHEMFWYARKE